MGIRCLVRTTERGQISLRGYFGMGERKEVVPVPRKEVKSDQMINKEAGRRVKRFDWTIEQGME